MALMTVTDEYGKTCEILVCHSMFLVALRQDRHRQSSSGNLRKRLLTIRTLGTSRLIGDGLTTENEPSDSPAIPPDPTLEGRRFSLVPLTPEYHRAVYQLSVRDIASFRWRYHGAIPPYQVFEQSLYTNVLVQFAIVPRQDPTQFVGLVVAYNAHFQDGYAFVAAVADRQSGAGTLEGVAILLRYMFAQWPFRKIYFEVPEFNVRQFQSAIDVGILQEEGRLIGHRYYSERYWDLVTYALYRERAMEFVRDTPGLFPELTVT